jgi:hypothetical protein
MQEKPPHLAAVLDSYNDAVEYVMETGCIPDDVDFDNFGKGVRSLIGRPRRSCACKLQVLNTEMLYYILYVPKVEKQESLWLPSNK